MVEVREVSEMEPGLTEAMAALLPRLSKSASALTGGIGRGRHPRGLPHFLVAEEDGALLGSLTLVVFPLPTGVRPGSRTWWSTATPRQGRRRCPQPVCVGGGGVAGRPLG